MLAIDTNVKLLTGAVVFVGRFAPAMFHPSWFLHYKLVRESEAANADLKISHPSIAQFQIGDFLVTAEGNRISFSSTIQSSFPSLRDLAVSTLQLLETVPIQQMGVNFSGHFSAKSQKTWHEFGHLYAPKAVWSEIMKDPGLHTMTIQGRNEATDSGYVRTKIEPSSQVGNGIFVEINNHFDFKDAKDGTAALKTLPSKWDMVEKSSYAMINAFVGKLASLEK